MITDLETNFLYLSNKLTEIRYSDFLTNFNNHLKRLNIKFQFLDNTNDIWCRDFMPIQVHENKFVQFRYEPYYLKNFDYLKTNPKKIKEINNFNIIHSDIILDGGNVVKSKEKVIITDQIVKDNKEKYTEKSLISKLQKLFEIEYIIIVPHLPYDWSGHADGIVRFFDEQTVLINDYSKTRQSVSWQTKFKRRLKNYNLKTIEIPYLEFEKKNDEGISPATGCYMNYLQIGETIFLPTFNIPEDEKAIKQFENELFKSKNVISVQANQIADRGGVLNCIAWNINK